jgi:hypothetical protein
MSWKMDLKQNVQLNYTTPPPSSFSIPIITITTMIIMMMITASKQGTKEIQKASTLGTAHVLKRNVNYKIFIMGNSFTCSTYCNHRIAATLYNLQKVFEVYNCKYPA